MGQDTVVGNKGSCWVGERFVVVVLAVTRSIPHCPFCAGERQRMVQLEDPFVRWCGVRMCGGGGERGCSTDSFYSIASKVVKCVLGSAVHGHASPTSQLVAQS